MDYDAVYWKDMGIPWCIQMRILEILWDIDVWVNASREQITEYAFR